MSSIDITSLDWDVANVPYVKEVTVQDSHIDVMGHTNNVVYVSWLEELAWGHSEAIGLDWARYEALGRTMVAHRHEIDYLGATFAGEQLMLGTWISENDGKLRVRRDYQFIRVRDNKTVVRAATFWVCADTLSGRPKRMPAEFVQGYQPINH